MSGYLLYRADEIRIGDRLVGLGRVCRIVRNALDDVQLFWADAPGAYVKVAADTEVLAERDAPLLPAGDASSWTASVRQHSQDRGAA